MNTQTETEKQTRTRIIISNIEWEIDEDHEYEIDVNELPTTIVTDEFMEDVIQTCAHFEDFMDWLDETRIEFYEGASIGNCDLNVCFEDWKDHPLFNTTLRNS